MTKNVLLLINTLPPVDTPDTPAPCRSTCPLSIHTPASCRYTRLLSIHPPPVNTPASCQYARLLSICLPPVNMPASCRYARLLSIWAPPVDAPALLSIHLPPVNTLASCRYARCVVDTPTLLSIRLPPVDTPALWSIYPPPVDTPVALSIHLWPYQYTCGPINTPALAVVDVGCGAADDVAGSMDAHIPQGGEGQGMTLRWWCSPVAPCWVELAGGGRNNGCIVTQVTRVTLSHNTSN